MWLLEDKRGIVMRRAVFALFLAACLVRPAAAACVVRQSADVPLEATPAGWLVTLDVNRTALPFLFDTGAERSMIFVSAADRIGIRRDEWVATTTRGIGGEVRMRNADPDTLTLGGLALRRQTLAADNTLVVAPMPPGEAAGLLGQDLLSPYDLQIDGPHATLTLFAVSDCTARSLPWSNTTTAIPASRPAGAVLLIPVGIDGHVLEAAIDSASAASLVTAAGTRKLGLSDATLASGPSGEAVGVGPRALPLRRHRFASITIGGTVSHDVPLWVGPAHLPRGIDLLLGRDWLASRMVWMSFATNTVFVSRDAGF